MAEGRRFVQGPPRVSRGRCRALYSKWENCCKIVHGFGWDQLDLLGDRACTGRFWFLSPRYLRAMVLPQNAQKGSRRRSRDSRSDAAPSKRNRALKQDRQMQTPLQSLASRRTAANIAKLPELLRMTLKGGVPRRAFATSKTPAA